MTIAKESADDPLLHAYEQRLAGSAAYHENLVSLPPPKLKKFDEGRALPFRGYSLVQWIQPQGELGQKLTALSRLLQEDFVLERIASSFYFLPAETFHATARDLLIGNPANEAHYIEAVRCTANRVGRSGQQAAQMLVEDLCFMGQSSIAVMLHPANCESLLTLIDVRAAIEEELERQGEPFTRTAAGDFFGHITITYPFGELDVEIYRKAKELVSTQSHRAGLLGELRFDAIELRRFDSMIDWSEPLETIRFPGGRD